MNHTIHDIGVASQIAAYSDAIVDQKTNWMHFDYGPVVQH